MLKGKLTKYFSIRMMSRILIFVNFGKTIKLRWTSNHQGRRRVDTMRKMFDRRVKQGTDLKPGADHPGAVTAGVVEATAEIAVEATAEIAGAVVEATAEIAGAIVEATAEAEIAAEATAEAVAAET